MRHTFWLIPLFIVVVASLTGCARSSRLEPTPTPTPTSSEIYNKAIQQRLMRERKATPEMRDYRIGPNDILEIKVYEQDKFSTTCRVGGDGTIRFSPLGLFKVMDMSERELESLLENKLRGEYLPDPHVTVYVKEPHAREVTIVGQVRTPGIYPLYQKKSLIDLISKAGGVTEQASNVAYVIRGDNGSENEATTPTQTVAVTQTAAEEPASCNILIDLDRLLVLGEEKWNVQLLAGDRVMVPEAGWVHVTGKGVEKAGTFKLRGSANNKLSQYIDEAGGMKFEASNNLQLLRRHPDGRLEIIPVNFKMIAKDHRNDIPMEREDTVIVNRNGVKTVLGGIWEGAKSIFRFSVGGYYDLFGTGNGRGGGYGY